MSVHTVSLDLLRVRILLGDSAVTVTSEVAGLGHSAGDCGVGGNSPYFLL